jgi:hypothetical protein
MAEEITEGKFIRYPHTEKMSRLIAGEIFKGGARVILSAPPRHVPMGAVVVSLLVAGSARDTGVV